MYKRDIPIIVSYVDSPEKLLSVVTFVLATIQTPLYRVRGMVQDIHSQGHLSPHLWGYKRQGYLHARNIVNALYDLHVDSQNGDLFDTLLEVPGLGYAKASFVMQLLGYPYGCLDSHNLKMLGVSKSKLRREEYFQYMNTKTSEQWWDDWCNHIPTTGFGHRFKDGDEVSRYHVDCITLG